MAPLIVLLAAFLVLTLVHRYGAVAWLVPARRGRLAIGLMFVFTGISHFFLVEEMAAMIPPVVPAREAVVYLTGAFEIAAAVGLLAPRLQRLTGYALIAFLAMVLPANVYGALNEVGTGGSTSGPGYLWFRIPLQLFFVGWIWYFALRPASSSTTAEPPPQASRQA